MHHLLMSNSQASDCSEKLLACAAECEGFSKDPIDVPWKEWQTTSREVIQAICQH